MVFPDLNGSPIPPNRKKNRHPLLENRNLPSYIPCIER